MAEQHDPIATTFLAMPNIGIAAGYTANILVPPGTLYGYHFKPGQG